MHGNLIKLLLKTATSSHFSRCLKETLRHQEIKASCYSLDLDLMKHQCSNSLIKFPILTEEKTSFLKWLTKVTSYGLMHLEVLDITKTMWHLILIKTQINIGTLVSKSLLDTTHQQLLNTSTTIMIDKRLSWWTNPMDLQWLTMHFQQNLKKASLKKELKRQSNSLHALL